MSLNQSFKKLLYLFVFIGYSLAFGGSYEDFFLAIERNDSSSVARLLERGFDPNRGVPVCLSPYKKSPWTPLKPCFGTPNWTSMP
jgi:hypothetical protein